MPRHKRIVQDQELEQAIKNTAWVQIQELGAAALSLRGIARQLGIAAPSIYHYYPNRDALVTALILDAFLSLAAAQQQAYAAASGDHQAVQLAVLGLVYRQWAIAQPQRYQLVFGTPIPGYIAPDEKTLPAAAACFVPLTQVLQSAFKDGKLSLKRFSPLTPALASMLEAWAQFEQSATPDVLYLALIFWSRIHGLIMFEVNGQYPSFISDPGEVYAREINNIVYQYLFTEE